MSIVGAFFADIAVTALLCFGMLAYLDKHLRQMLIELCGTAERARFWLAFSNVTLVLVPLIFALGYEPQMGANKALMLEMAAQLKWALI